MIKRHQYDSEPSKRKVDTVSGIYTNLSGGAFVLLTGGYFKKLFPLKEDDEMIRTPHKAT